MARILVVDDEPALVKLLAFVLEKDSHEVRTAADGLAALTAIDAARPDLILLDVMMPGMDGYSLSARLQENPSLCSIPIIILSAHARMKDMFQAQGNVIRFVEKPFDSKNLRALVREVLAPTGASGPLGPSS